jgi:VanZ family protein
MLYYIKRYPLSLLIIGVVTYLSFFRPPSIDLVKVVGLDKVVHICMYLGMSGMLWLEFLRVHKKDNTPLWHVWVGASACPILFSGTVEILQATLTTYRGGDWLDFLANTTGVCIASAIAYWVVRPRMIR